jgi:hypothetical protein
MDSNHAARLKSAGSRPASLPEATPQRFPPTRADRIRTAEAGPPPRLDRPALVSSSATPFVHVLAASGTLLLLRLLPTGCSDTNMNGD